MKWGEHLEKGNHFISEKWQSRSFEKGKHIGLPVRIRPQCNSDNLQKMSKLGFLGLKDGRIMRPIFSSYHPLNPNSDNVKNPNADNAFY